MVGHVKVGMRELIYMICIANYDLLASVRFIRIHLLFSSLAVALFALQWGYNHEVSDLLPTKRFVWVRKTSTISFLQNWLSWYF